MHHIFKALIIVLIIGDLAGQAASGKNPSQIKNVVQGVNTPPIVRQQCVRSIAKPIVKRSVFPKTSFRLNKDKLTGIETVNFKNGEKLIINNAGCEYYALTFRFETARFQARVSDLDFWFKKAVLLMNEIHRGIRAPIDLKKGTAALDRYISRNRSNLKLTEEIDFGGSDIRDFVSINKLQKLRGQRFALEISFATGPL